MLDGDVTDIVEAQSLSFSPEYIDVYLAGWGPKDDGATLDGPGPLTRLVLQNSVQTVRKKSVAVFVYVCVPPAAVYLLLELFCFFPQHQYVNIINKLISSVCFTQIISGPAREGLHLCLAVRKRRGKR